MLLDHIFNNIRPYKLIINSESKIQLSIHYTGTMVIRRSYLEFNVNSEETIYV